MVFNTSHNLDILGPIVQLRQKCMLISTVKERGITLWQSFGTIKKLLMELLAFLATSIKNTIRCSYLLRQCTEQYTMYKRSVASCALCRAALLVILILWHEPHMNVSIFLNFAGQVPMQRRHNDHTAFSTDQRLHTSQRSTVVHNNNACRSAGAEIYPGWLCFPRRCTACMEQSTTISSNCFLARSIQTPAEDISVRP